LTRRAKQEHDAIVAGGRIGGVLDGGLSKGDRVARSTLVRTFVGTDVRRMTRPVWCTVTVTPPVRPAIEGFFGGNFALQLEADREGAIAAYSIHEIAGLLGNDMRRKLKPLYESRWGQHPFARGSYSHALPGACGGPRRAVRAGGLAQLDGTYHEQLYILGRIADKLSVDCPRMKSHAPLASLSRIRSSSTEDGIITGRNSQSPRRHGADRHSI